ncbi:serine hydrolase, partial [Porticoccaceae bacterium]|nr:serine hydrolase [Porticoccaceae bacterium]
APTQITTIDLSRSIYSSAADMAKWLRFQLNNGKVGDQQIIAESAFKALRESYVAGNFEFPGVVNRFVSQGLGLLISDSTSGHKYYSSGGNLEGYESYHAFVPELNLGIAIMINCIQVIPQPLVAWIIDRYTGAPERDWVNEQIPYYLKLEDKVLADLEEARLAITDNSKNPRLPLASYCGHYQHPLLGDLLIEPGATAGDLSFTLGRSYAGALLHANHDTFYIKVANTHYGRYVFNGPAQFRLNPAGEVCSVYAMDNEFQKME